LTPNNLTTGLAVLTLQEECSKLLDFFGAAASKSVKEFVDNGMLEVVLPRENFVEIHPDHALSPELAPPLRPLPPEGSGGSSADDVDVDEEWAEFEDVAGASWPPIMSVDATVSFDGTTLAPTLNVRLLREQHAAYLIKVVGGHVAVVEHSWVVLD
jgi:hypothetical protein